MTRLSPETACAILASHGADPARWPADARADLPALAARDAGVAAALADARALDAALAGWLARPLPAMAVNVAAITAQPQQQAQRQAGQRPQPPRRWMPAAVAASLALVVAVGGWLGTATPFGSEAPVTVAAAPSPSAGASLAEADAAFAYVFTPTAAEEEMI